MTKDVSAESRVSCFGFRVSEIRAPETRLLAWAAVVLSTLVLAACKTAPIPDQAPATPLLSEFMPADYVTGIRLEKGRYPDLFAPDSYAIWLGPDVASMRRAATIKRGEVIDPKLEAASKHITEDFLVFECHVASAFSDMSIGYDLVGLRGVNVYLATPDGQRIAPVQTVIASSASEIPQEALKKFSRTNLIVFPKRDLWKKKGAVADNAVSVRLVLEAHGSTFCFEWPAAIEPATPWLPSKEEISKVLKTGFKETYGQLADLMHVFD